MHKGIDYAEVVLIIKAKRKKLGIIIDPRRFLPIFREQVRYKKNR